jgi:hypothetical protein
MIPLALAMPCSLLVSATPPIRPHVRPTKSSSGPVRKGGHLIRQLLDLA